MLTKNAPATNNLDCIEEEAGRGSEEDASPIRDTNGQDEE